DRTRVEFDMDQLLRPDLLTRMQANQAAINSGQKLINEARAEEGLPPVPGGDVPPINSTMVPISQAGRDERPRGAESDAVHAAGAGRRRTAIGRSPRRLSLWLRLRGPRLRAL